MTLNCTNKLKWSLSRKETNSSVVKICRQLISLQQSSWFRAQQFFFFMKKCLFPIGIDDTFFFSFDYLILLSLKVITPLTEYWIVYFNKLGFLMKNIFSYLLQTSKLFQSFLLTVPWLSWCPRKISGLCIDDLQFMLQ